MYIFQILWNKFRIRHLKTYYYWQVKCSQYFDYSKCWHVTRKMFDSLPPPPPKSKWLLGNFNDVVSWTVTKCDAWSFIKLICKAIDKVYIVLKYSGLYVDNRLMWKAHIDYGILKLFFLVFWNIRDLFDKKTKKCP